VDGLLDAAGPRPVKGEIRALIAPHAGYRYSGPTAAAAFALVRGRDFARVIVLAPSHRSPFHGISIAQVSAYETPLGQVPLDSEAVARIRRSPLALAEPQAHVREHAIEIELPMLQRALKPGWRLVPVLVGQLDESDYGPAAELLRPLADGKTLIVASSDFTHYGARFDYQPFPADDRLPERIRALDQGAIDRILARDGPGLLDYQARTGITVCGIRPLALLLRLLPPESSVESIAYGTSGELTGDWESSVSYAALAATAPAPLSDSAPSTPPSTPGPSTEASAPSAPGSATGVAPGPTPGSEPGSAPGEPAAPESVAGEPDGTVDGPGLERLHRLAVLGIQGAVLGQSPEREAALAAEVAALPEGLKAPSGAFVTLKRNGALRGCIGYIRGVKPLYQAVMENGDNAARNDRRFRPLEPGELDGLEVEVSVLSPLKPVASVDELRVGEHGIVLHKDGRAAVFLPEVATEQGWDLEETLSALASKAGLPADAWRDGASFEVFTSTKVAAPFPAGQ
jgi:AmmeMemoRadiSam system protein B/AmmeMemoRadiSam system protein A